MRKTLQLLVVAIVALATSVSSNAQTFPPWSKGQNNPATDKGYVFSVSDIDNVPDLHGNPEGAKLVLFVGGN
jgi:hypothetical protein